MSILNTIRKKDFCEYVQKTTKQEVKSAGRWKTIETCPICGHKGCFRITPDDKGFFCFSCWQSGDIVKFRSLVENCTYHEALAKFGSEMGIKSVQQDIDWILIKQMACEYTVENLFTNQTKYRFRGIDITPLDYLTETRKHSIEAILNFHIGFQDGGLVDNLKTKFGNDVLVATGLLTKNGHSGIPKNLFVYPHIVDGNISHFRFKDPNKLNNYQMPGLYRSKNAVWYNQDVLTTAKDIWCVEGEDDLVSLWDCGIDAVASLGTVTNAQVRWFEKFGIETVYCCFDPDDAGKRDTANVVKLRPTSTYIINLPDGKDIDDVIRKSSNLTEDMENLRNSASLPSLEETCRIKVKNDGYYIMNYNNNGDEERRLSNWTMVIEAHILDQNEQITWEITLKMENGMSKIVFIPAIAFANLRTLKEYLLNQTSLLYFTGSDMDLTELLKYFAVAYKPKSVVETLCVGDTEHGWIGDNVFISNSGEVKPLKNTFLSLDEHNSIKIVPLVQRGGRKSELPHYSLIEPAGGYDKFRTNVYDLLVKNRNYKVLLAIGWLKSTIWAADFYKKYRFFPLLCLHGKYQSGKSLFGSWLMSMVGLRDVNPELLSDRGTTEVGLARKLAYYSSLPVFVDDYRSDDTGQRFHSYFRGVFDRSSGTKGLKQEFGVRRVDVNGCLLITGEHIPADPALLSRMIAIEFTRAEITPKYYKTILKAEQYFNILGFNWVKSRKATFPEFLQQYEEVYDYMSGYLDDPRQAGCLSVAIAGMLTEKYIDRIDLCDFGLKIAKIELSERKNEEHISQLWEAVGVLKSKGELKAVQWDYEWSSKRIYFNLPALLAAVNGNQSTRHYKLPNHREIVKLLKQEPYMEGMKVRRFGDSTFKCWVLVLDNPDCPEIVREMVDFQVSTEEIGEL